MNCATESEEQKALFKWAGMQSCRYPELRMLHHIPNGGYRSAQTAARLKAEGVKPGVPDLCLPVARGGCHGLYIELKRRQGGRVSPEQAAWMDALMDEGYQAAVCRGWEAARDVILAYLGGTET